MNDVEWIVSAEVAAPKTEVLPAELFSDLSIFKRKWSAALKLGQALPLFEDVMLGSLGRLADRITILRDDGHELTLLRAGRDVEAWLEAEIHDTPLGVLPPDCALSLQEAVLSAHKGKKPYLASAHCVRHGNVQVYDVLALPMVSRWGDRLTGVYVIERGEQYDILDAIFAATNDGIVSLAGIRDFQGDITDFQIVYLNPGAADLLGISQQDLRWQRLSAGGARVVVAHDRRAPGDGNRTRHRRSV